MPSDPLLTHQQVTLCSACSITMLHYFVAPYIREDTAWIVIPVCSTFSVTLVPCACSAGNFATQVLGNILGTCGLLLTLFATWQYTLNMPHCCQSSHNSSANHSEWGSPRTAPNQGLDCTALHNHVVLQSWSLDLPPTLNLALAVCGLVVSATCV